MKDPEKYNEFVKEQLAYRFPRQITTIIIGNDGYSNFYCPSCNGYINFDYQAYCSGCGQALDWDGIRFIDDIDLFDD